MLRLQCFGKSDPGRRRSNNEDALLLRPELGLLAVADGMGGQEGGEVASRIFIETALEVFTDSCTDSEEECHRSVQKAFALANERILEEARRNRFGKMGCTAELAALCPPGYVLGHVGDSRAYLLRKGELRQLTRDHSLVQEQVEEGLITPEEAKKHSMRNVILRAVGVDETLAVDLLRGRGQTGDLLLLCSDGLTSMVEDGDIQNLLLRPMSLEQKVDRLIQAANSAGGADNITVVLCEIIES
jgi:PPM family protein phosphatase